MSDSGSKSRQLCRWSFRLLKKAATGTNAYATVSEFRAKQFPTSLVVRAAPFALILRHAAGEDVSSITMPANARGVMMIPIPGEGVYVNVSGLEVARSTPGVEDVSITAKQGQKLVQLPEGNSYLGFIFASGESPEFAEQALRAAHARLRFEIATALPVV